MAKRRETNNHKAVRTHVHEGVTYVARHGPYQGPNGLFYKRHRGHEKLGYTYRRHSKKKGGYRGMGFVALGGRR